MFQSGTQAGFHCGTQRRELGIQPLGKFIKFQLRNFGQRHRAPADVSCVFVEASSQAG